MRSLLGRERYKTSSISLLCRGFLSGYNIFTWNVRIRIARRRTASSPHSTEPIFFEARLIPKREKKYLFFTSKIHFRQEPYSIGRAFSVAKFLLRWFELIVLMGSMQFEFRVHMFYFNSRQRDLINSFFNQSRGLQRFVSFWRERKFPCLQ